MSFYLTSLALALPMTSDGIHPSILSLYWRFSWYQCTRASLHSFGTLIFLSNVISSTPCILTISYLPTYFCFYHAFYLLIFLLFCFDVFNVQWENIIKFIDAEIIMTFFCILYSSYQTFQYLTTCCVGVKCWTRSLTYLLIQYSSKTTCQSTENSS